MLVDLLLLKASAVGLDRFVRYRPTASRAEHRERGSSKRIVLGARSRCRNEHRPRSRKQVSQEGSAPGFHESRVGKCGGSREVGTQVQATFGASRLFGHAVVRSSLLLGLRARGSHRHRRLGAGPVKCSRVRCLASRWRRGLTRRPRGVVLHPQRRTWVARLIRSSEDIPKHWPRRGVSRQCESRRSRERCDMPAPP
jgi:hypothetical protein